jgi:DNA-binding response OmpR family regulator
MDAAPIHALLAEDDEKLARLVREYLERHSIRVRRVSNGVDATTESQRGDVDVVLLDLMLPLRGGLEVCQMIRAVSHIPIVIVTARTDVEDRVYGLELGADDYITKPFEPRELVARLQAVVRRARGRAGPSEKVLRLGRLVLDAGAYRATLDDAELSLTSDEFALLRVLAERAGHVLGREQLLELTKGNAEDAFDRSIDVRISRLRQKLEADPRRPQLLKTVRGVGYVLVADTDS